MFKLKWTSKGESDSFFWPPLFVGEAGRTNRSDTSWNLNRWKLMTSKKNWQNFPMVKRPMDTSTFGKPVARKRLLHARGCWTYTSFLRKRLVEVLLVGDLWVVCQVSDDADIDAAYMRKKCAHKWCTKLLWHLLRASHHQGSQPLRSFILDKFLITPIYKTQI